MSAMTRGETPPQGGLGCRAWLPLRPLQDSSAETKRRGLPVNSPAPPSRWGLCVSGATCPCVMPWALNRAKLWLTETHLHLQQPTLTRQSLDGSGLPARRVQWGEQGQPWLVPTCPCPALRRALSRPIPVLQPGTACSSWGRWPGAGTQARVSEDFCVMEATRLEVATVPTERHLLRGRLPHYHPPPSPAARQEVPVWLPHGGDSHRLPSLDAPSVHSVFLVFTYN